MKLNTPIYSAALAVLMNQAGDGTHGASGGGSVGTLTTVPASTANEPAKTEQKDPKIAKREADEARAAAKAKDEADRKAKRDADEAARRDAEAAMSPEAREAAKKKEAAERALRQATEAQKAAAAAAATAKRLAEEASALQAEAEGKVIAVSPSTFNVVFGPDNKVLIRAGNNTVAREVAEHPYAVKRGVKIIGAPIK